MRTFVISDIHGCLDEFLKLLKLIDYIPNKDKLILLGDYVDRGPKSKEVIEEIIKISQNENVIILRGNHDQRFLSLLEDRGEELYQTFIKYGGKETIDSYCPENEGQSINEKLQFINTRYQHHIQFLKNTKIYDEDEKFIFVHAGLNPEYEDWRKQPISDFLSIRENFTHKNINVDKKIVFGHTVVQKLHNSDDIWFSNNKIGIDGGCAMKRQLNCLEILEKNEFNEYAVQCLGE